MCTPAIALLRQIFPQATIDAICRRSVAPVFSGSRDLNSVIVADERDLSREQLMDLRNRGYDAALLFTNSLRSAWAAYRIGIPRRIGFSRNARRLLLTLPLHYNSYDWQTPTPEPISRKSIPPDEHRQEQPDALPGKRPHHMTDYYACLALWTAESLGYTPAPNKMLETGPMRIEVLPEADTTLDQLLAQHNLAGRVLIGVNPGAAYGKAKRWPLPRMAEVADLLAAKYNAAIVSTASRAEAALDEELNAISTCDIVPLGQQLDLNGLAALVRRMKLLITNDSGTMHIAAALRTPTVAIFGPTDWNVTAPYHANAEIVRQSPRCAPCLLRECPIDHRCMLDVQVQDVIAAAERVWQRQ
jgi:heptosyltransferase-2